MTVPNVALLFERLQLRAGAPAVVFRERETSAGDLLKQVDNWVERLSEAGLGAGSVCGYLGDYSPGTTALFLALMQLRAVAVPFTRAAEGEIPTFASIAGLEALVRFDEADRGNLERWSPQAANDLVQSFRAAASPGLIVFTSGSTGQPKGILHDLDRVLSKFEAERPGWRMILFLMMDHFGGVNTLLSCLSHGGVAVCIPDRSPDTVCETIERQRAEVLPATPTFLNMLISSGVWRDRDLSGLKLITYGAEPMPEATLRRARAIFPNAKLKQTYGLSELGVIHSQSPDPSSLWLRIGGAGFETRVVGGVLQIRSRSSMVGYLNAPNPIDAEGWMSTGDLVEEREGMIRFLGRVTEIINVGGQKVFPTEVETTLLEAENVADATVVGVPHPLLGQAVVARVSLVREEAPEVLVERLRVHCRERLAKFKVPLRFQIVDIADQGTSRAKKQRGVEISEPTSAQGEASRGRRSS